MKRKQKPFTAQSLAPRPSPRAPSTADLLLEIGTEELPAAYLSAAIEQLRQEAERLFRDQFLEIRAVEAFGTPRRLILLAHRVSAIQRKPPEEIRGPSKQAAFDAGGKPTDALRGFLKAKGGRLSQIKLVLTDKGEYLYLLKPECHTPTGQVLPQVIEQLIGRLRFPKTMRWDDSPLRFARPIRWLLVLYGTTPIRVSVGRLTSGRSTWVGGPKRPSAHSVTSVTQYFAVLTRHGILFNQRKRKQRIGQLVKQVAKQHRGVPPPEMVTYGLLDEVTALVEQPVALLGQFDPKYLELPREVLLASMAKYQRVFAIQAHSQRLLPKFVGILDGTPRKPSQVRRLYEHILNARLADSLLFWEQDHKGLPLDERLERLRDVTLHERLGSMADKTLRLRGLSEPLAEAWQLTDEERQHLRRACQLAKADLVSTMVKEFPTLQGVMGKYYARDSREPPEVADAIEEQYLPIGERLPTTLIGMALSIIDKYDTLTSYFGLGIEPTGDADPFGLRRAAQGIVEVAWTAHRPLPLNPLLRARASMEPFRSAQPKEIAAVGHRVQHYLFERLHTFSWPAPADAPGGPGPQPNPSHDLIEAILSSPCDDLVDVMDRIRGLQQLDGQQTLLRAAKVVERTRNILKNAALRQTEVDPARLQEPLEQKLWELYHTHKDRLLQLIQDKSYAEATTAYGEVFFDVLHEFFEQVLVNVNEEALQQNRLALMRAINALYTDHIADLSKLVILQPRTNFAQSGRTK